MFWSFFFENTLAVMVVVVLLVLLLLCLFLDMSLLPMIFVVPDYIFQCNIVLGISSFLLLLFYGCSPNQLGHGFGS